MQRWGADPQAGPGLGVGLLQAISAAGFRPPVVCKLPQLGTGAPTDTLDTELATQHPGS